MLVALSEGQALLRLQSHRLQYHHYDGVACTIPNFWSGVLRTLTSSIFFGRARQDSPSWPNMLLCAHSNVSLAGAGRTDFRGFTSRIALRKFAKSSSSLSERVNLRPKKISSPPYIGDWRVSTTDPSSEPELGFCQRSVLACHIERT